MSADSRFSLPPREARVSSPTEDRNPRSLDIDTLASTEIVDRILSDDATVVAAVHAVSASLGELAELCVTALAAGGRVHYVGAGTSGRLGVLDAVELLPTYNVDSDVIVAHLAGGDQAMMRAVEGAEDNAEDGRALIREVCFARDVVIGLAASGRTPFVRGALDAARELGCSTGLISSNPTAPIAPLADVAVLVDTGPEIITGSTRMKAATAQKIALNALSTTIMVRLGKTYSNLMIDVRATNEKLVDRMVRIIEMAAGVDATRARETLEATGGQLRPALVLALAGADVRFAEKAEALVTEHAPTVAREGDASGIRTAAAQLRSIAAEVQEVRA